jgi:syntaxin 18
LTDSQRDQIDAESKDLLRELNEAIRTLADAEALRRSSEEVVAEKRRRKKGLGAIGRWAAGGVGFEEPKTPEELDEEAKSNTIKIHRESVIWFLRQRLESCGDLQRTMVETRLVRELEKSKSVLYNAKGADVPARTTTDAATGKEPSYGSLGSQTGADRGYLLDEEERKAIEQQLSPEQLQLFAKENSDMLKHYEDTLDQVRLVYSRSLLLFLLYFKAAGNSIATTI